MKKVLILLDEVTKSKEIGLFASAYQIFIRQNLPVYLIMTGLFENIDALQNEDNLTFLYRAPKIELKPLNIGSIADSYADTFNLSPAKAKEMAKLTKGYPYAFQMLGYFTWRNNGDYKASITPYRRMLEEAAYEKMWSETSPKDKQVMFAIANVKSGSTSEIVGFLKFKPNEINQYRKRLTRRGLINGETRGKLTFTLPMFEEFVLDVYEPE